MNIESLISKYNIPVPRYTSYPTVPYWGENLAPQTELTPLIINNFTKNNKTTGISIYIHLPYCENLCTFCACTRVITRNHGVEDKYIDTVISEWKLYLEILPEKPVIREIHIGGGTPTFFSPENLKRLTETIINSGEIHPEHEFSFEAHPGITSKKHLQTFYDVGFRRVSFGIQDFDELVQKTINRENKFETVSKITNTARDIGYKSINYDLVYGLPNQKQSSIEKTIKAVNELRPDRIAFYSYAHVPWKMKTQRSFSEKDLPSNQEKRKLYETGKKLLKENGYFDIGLDHFSLKNDELYTAYTQRRLHRNFMGYNTSHSKILIGLGASAISDFDKLYIQNEKHIKNYEQKTANKDFPYTRSYTLSEEDYIIKKAILSIICHRRLTINNKLRQTFSSQAEIQFEEMKNEGLITRNDNTIEVTELGMVFLRNICSILDTKLNSNKITTFSKSI